MTGEQERAAIAAYVGGLINKSLSQVANGASIESSELMLGGLAWGQFIKEAIERGDHLQP